MTGSPFRARLTATALTAGALLMQEVVVGRLLSVVTWYSLGYFLDYQVAGVPPEIMGVGPVPAVKKLLAKNNLK
ncbi:MAG TPA: hypothetical protein VE153_22720, partial [Myxococcus sp.]|nr:hypothetical protein [Myxococcus sp.]